MEAVALIAKVDCRVFVISSLKETNKQHCRANTTKSFLVLGKILFYTKMIVHFCSSSKSKISIFGGTRGILGFIQGYLKMKSLPLDLF